MILLIDNYDSFSFNLVQAIGELAAGQKELKVVRNDEITVAEVFYLLPTNIVLSPGPGRPSGAGICEELILAAMGKIPLLGVCLGHQAICEVLGGKIVYAPELMHGRQSIITVDNTSTIFQGLPQTVEAARYHSLAADKNSLPDSLKVTAKDEQGVIMAVQHKTEKLYGLQFHPESILTPRGKEAEQVMDEIMSGEAEPVNMAAFLTAFRMKGETVEEISAFAKGMRKHGVHVSVKGDVLEIVGTGGDEANSINISTTASIVVAAAGYPVAKHGNRSVSSKSGAADCLEALGVSLN